MGHERGRRKRGRGMLGLDFGLVSCDFGGIVEREEGSIVYLDLGHTHYIWLDLARRVREPVEVSWARNYFLVG